MTTTNSINSEPTWPPLAARKVIFLGHATPEDNAIAAWFGARLTAAGYTVWTDLTRLLGGEEMWFDIDDALRHHVRKYVALLSHASVRPEKEGFRAELIRAEAIRKRLGDRRFVIPIRVDDVPFEDSPPTVGNRTIIDASANLADGLKQLVKILQEDHVTSSHTSTSATLSMWLSLISNEAYEPEIGTENLVTNWLEITRLPENLRVYSIERPLSNLNEAARIASNHPLPMTAHLRRLVAFADYDEVQEPVADTTPIKFERLVSVSDFLRGDDENFVIEPFEAQKQLKSLLRQAFDTFAREKGLFPYELSPTKTAWWVPDGLSENPKVHFVRPSGTSGWRQLTGEYGLRKRRWHFGVNAVPFLGNEFWFKMTGHVIFTDPSGAAQPTAEFRRRMCKFWFNGKWRDLFFALVHLMSSGTTTLELPFGREDFATVETTPIIVPHPRCIPAAAEERAPTNVEHEGDAEDLDASERELDPAFLENQDSEESNTEPEEEV